MDKYGPTLTVDELAQVLKRRPQGVRAALSLRTEAWAAEMNSRKVYVGRRVYFPVHAVADLIAGSLVQSEAPGSEALEKSESQCDENADRTPCQRRERASSNAT